MPETTNADALCECGHTFREHGMRTSYCWHRIVTGNSYEFCQCAGFRPAVSRVVDIEGEDDGSRGGSAHEGNDMVAAGVVLDSGARVADPTPEVWKGAWNNWIAPFHSCPRCGNSLNWRQCEDALERPLVSAECCGISFGAPLGEPPCVADPTPVSPGAARDEQIERVQAVFRAGPNEMFPLHPEAAPPRCNLPPDGWLCTRKPGHEGPCAAVPCDGELIAALDVVLEAAEPGLEYGDPVLEAAIARVRLGQAWVSRVTNDVDRPELSVIGAAEAAPPHYRAIHEATCSFRLAGAPHPCTCAEDSRCKKWSGDDRCVRPTGHTGGCTFADDPTSRPRASIAASPSEEIGGPFDLAAALNDFYNATQDGDEDSGEQAQTAICDAFADGAREAERLRAAINTACAIIELGDQRLLASDGDAGGQPPELSLAEWRTLYVTLDSARASLRATPPETTTQQEVNDAKQG
jgi:hypothetical protein